MLPDANNDVTFSGALRMGTRHGERAERFSQIRNYSAKVEGEFPKRTMDNCWVFSIDPS